MAGAAGNGELGRTEALLPACLVALAIRCNKAFILQMHWTAHSHNSTMCFSLLHLRILT